jgi:hypothetical protein
MNLAEFITRKMQGFLLKWDTAIKKYRAFNQGENFSTPLTWPKIPHRLLL